MKAILRAGISAAIMLGAGTAEVRAQSSGSSSGPASSNGLASSAASSPFSGLFGGRKGNASSPVDLDFTLQGGDDSLMSQIRATSLLVSAQDEGRVTGQDMLAAARGDYARILGVLYDNGFYSGLIDITLDGVEAATIAPLDAPKTVRKVVVKVDPGPIFRYSRAQIAPVAPGTKLPSEYHTGAIARTSDMKSAATEAVKGWRNVGHAKADVAQTDITADHAINKIDSRILLAPGPELRFGQLTILLMA